MLQKTSCCRWYHFVEFITLQQAICCRDKHVVESTMLQEATCCRLYHIVESIMFQKQHAVGSIICRKKHVVESIMLQEAIIVGRNMLQGIVFFLSYPSLYTCRHPVVPCCRTRHTLRSIMQQNPSRCSNQKTMNIEKCWTALSQTDAVRLLRRVQIVCSGISCLYFPVQVLVKSQFPKNFYMNSWSNEQNRDDETLVLTKQILKGRYIGIEVVSTE